jgi:hypothetical protein
MIYFIMPVGSDPQFTRKRLILKGVLERSDQTGHFPLEKREEGEFDVDVAISEMERSQLIIADLALERPSCYFEVGIAQAAGLNVHLIASAGTAIHQVAGRAHVLFYEDENDYENLIMMLIGGTMKRGEKIRLSE